MTNAEKFLNAFSRIEHELYRLLNLTDHRRFYDLVRRAAKFNPVIQRYKFDLKEYGDLRNAIVHDRHGGQIIAQPIDEVVEHIEQIAAQLLEPPRVIPHFQKEVLTLTAEDSVASAIREMSRLAYSQVAIRDHEVITAMLTSTMVTHWLGQSMLEGGFDLDAATIGQALEKVGREDNYRLVSANTTFLEALDLFARHQQEGKKLEAVIITENGQPHESFLGIITNRDLPQLQQP